MRTEGHIGWIFAGRGWVLAAILRPASTEWDMDVADGDTVRQTSGTADVVLGTGVVASIRPVVPSDRRALEALYADATPDSQRLRFFGWSTKSGHQDVERMLRDSPDHIALIARGRDAVLGVASVERDSRGDHGEFAVFVSDAHHAEGVGTLLLEHLISRARDAGYRKLQGDVLGDNYAMLGVLRELGQHVSSSYTDGVVRVEFSLAPDLQLQLAADARDGSADYASLRRLFSPRSIAVVGAGHDSDGPGHRIVAHILAGGFRGKTFVVNRSGSTVCGLASFASLRDLPETPELVIVAVPDIEVLRVIQDAAAVEACGALVISDGFSERGIEGRDLQDLVLAAARDAGMRLIGPNCLGVVNTAEETRLNATFADSTAVLGRVGVATQSGGIGLALMGLLSRDGLGVSTFVSMGNKADISGNDVLSFWEHDPATDFCVLYLESFGNARKFARIARRVARKKPVIAVTVGRSEAGARGARSHTAAAATPTAVSDTLLSECGVIRVRNLPEVSGVLRILTAAPLPAGRRVAILTNGGGPGALAADAAAAAGLVLPPLSVATQRALRRLLPGHAATSNPVDSTAGASAASLSAAARVLLDSAEVDSVLFIHTSIRTRDTDEIAAQLAREVDAGVTRPLIGVFLGHPDVPPALRLPTGASVLPTYPYPEEALTALAAVASYGEWRGSPEPTAPRLVRIHRAAARRLVEGALESPAAGGWMDTDAAAALLHCYAVPIVESLRVHDPTTAVIAAEKYGYPVAVKSAGGHIVHRSDVGAVAVGLASGDAVRAAVSRIHAAVGHDCPLIVQPMLREGVEIAVGVTQDPTVGPLLMVGIGGVATDLLADRVFALPPISRARAHKLVRSLRSSALLFGYRQTPPADVDALVELILRVSALAQDIPQVRELDLNPVLAGPNGAVAVDVKVRLEPTTGPASMARQLPARR
jgi:acyl-CoA synthetase (NDP forming)/GNAT superfamily N-acetyltransferase